MLIAVSSVSVEQSAASEEVQLIGAALKVISDAQQIRDLDTPEMRENTDKMFEYFHPKNISKRPAAEVSALFAAFLQGNAAGAFKRLLQLRSEGPATLDFNRSHFAAVYRNFNVTFMNAMCRRTGWGASVQRHFLEGGCIPFILRELSSADFQAARDSNPMHSPVAENICTVLGILYNVAINRQQRSRMGEELRGNEFIRVLRPFALSKYICTL